MAVVPRLRKYMTHPDRTGRSATIGILTAVGCLPDGLADRLRQMPPDAVQVRGAGRRGALGGEGSGGGRCLRRQRGAPPEASCTACVCFPCRLPRGAQVRLIARVMDPQARFAPDLGQLLGLPGDTPVDMVYPPILEVRC